MSNTMKMSRKSKGGRNRQNKQAGRDVIPHPPPIQKYEIRHGTRLRFVSNAAIGQAITFQNLLDTILVAATATTGFDAFFAVKVRAVEVWSMPAIGTSNTVEVSFAGTSAASVGDQSVHTDSSMGVEPAHVRAVPARRSLASNYQLAGAGTAFTLYCPTGSVVDVELSFLDAFITSIAAQNALIGAVAGATYLRGLDGLAAATTKLPTALTTYQI